MTDLSRVYFIYPGDEMAVYFRTVFTSMVLLECERIFDQGYEVVGTEGIRR